MEKRNAALELLMANMVLQGKGGGSLASKDQRELLECSVCFEMMFAPIYPGEGQKACQQAARRPVPWSLMPGQSLLAACILMDVGLSRGSCSIEQVPVEVTPTFLHVHAVFQRACLLQRVQAEAIRKMPDVQSAAENPSSSSGEASCDLPVALQASASGLLPGGIHALGTLLLVHSLASYFPLSFPLSFALFFPLRLLVFSALSFALAWARAFIQ